jgi:hypothetical protein
MSWGVPTAGAGEYLPQELGSTYRRSWGVPTAGVGEYLPQELGSTYRRSWGVPTSGAGEYLPQELDDNSMVAVSGCVVKSCDAIVVSAVH